MPMVVFTLYINLCGVQSKIYGFHWWLLLFIFIGGDMLLKTVQMPMTFGLTLVRFCKKFPPPPPPPPSEIRMVCLFSRISDLPL